jgi:hypothetical protein
VFLFAYTGPFFEMGANCSSLYIKIMHTALSIKSVFKVLSVLLQLESSNPEATLLSFRKAKKK